MTPADRPRFAELMLGIGEVYGEPVSEIRMELYFSALEHLSLDAVRAAANAHVRTNKFFPKPAELLEAVHGSDEDRADLAWVEMLREVRRAGYIGTPQFTDPVARRAAMELYGGWTALCERLPASGPEQLGVAKLFKATYVAYSRRDVRALLTEAPTKEEARLRLVSLKDELTKRGLPAHGLTQ